VIEPQLRETLLDRTFEIARRQQRRLYLGGDHHLVALAGGAHALAHFPLIIVHLRGVDVAVADADRLLDQPRAIASAQRPGAETDQRNFKYLGPGRRHQGVSHTGACGGLTTRILVALSFLSSAISASSSLKSNTSRLAFR